MNDLCSVLLVHCQLHLHELNDLLLKSPQWPDRVPTGRMFRDWDQLVCACSCVRLCICVFCPGFHEAFNCVFVREEERRHVWVFVAAVEWTPHTHTSTDKLSFFSPSLYLLLSFLSCVLCYSQLSDSTGLPFQIHNWLDTTISHTFPPQTLLTTFSPLPLLLPFHLSQRYTAVLCLCVCVSVNHGATCHCTPKVLAAKSNLSPLPLFLPLILPHPFRSRMLSLLVSFGQHPI